MAKAKKKKKSTLGYVMLAVVLVFAILAVVGIFLDWTVTQLNGETIEGSGVTLSDYQKSAEIAGKFGIEESTAEALCAVGYLAVAAVCVLFAAYVIKQLFSVGLFRIIVIIGGVVTAVLGIVAIAYTASVVGDMSTGSIDIGIGELGNNGAALGIGCYLTAIGAIGGGLAAALGSFKK